MKKSLLLLSFLMTTSLFVVSVEAMQQAETAGTVTAAKKSRQKKAANAEGVVASETTKEVVASKKAEEVEKVVAAQGTPAQRSAFKQRVTNACEKLYNLGMDRRTAYILAIMCGVCHVYPMLLPWVISSFGFAAPMATAEAAAATVVAAEGVVAGATVVGTLETAKAMALTYWTVVHSYGMIAANVLWKSLMPAMMGRFIQTEAVPALCATANATASGVNNVTGSLKSGVTRLRNIRKPKAA